MEAGPEAESFVNAVVGGRGVLEALVIDGPLLVYARCGPDDSALGKNANCQTLVSLTLARNEVPVMVALRLFLPRVGQAILLALAPRTRGGESDRGAGDRT